MFKVINCCYDLYFTEKTRSLSIKVTIDYSEGWVSELRFRRIHYLFLEAIYFTIVRGRGGVCPLLL